MDKKISLSKLNTIKISDLVKKLEKFSYARVEEVKCSGEYSVAGGIVYIWPTNMKDKCLVDFFGDVIERIKINNKLAHSIDIFQNMLDNFDGAKIKPGDYAVHIDHGIGLFSRIGVKEIGAKLIRYAYLEYQNGDMLYLPLSLADEKITKYIGVGRKPKLNKLGSQAWNRSKKRAYENALKLASELINIYASRELSQSDQYKIDSDWDREVRKTFVYTETDDQKKAIEDVYKDLQSKKPMDRLVSGDVGFGKTEVAMRALVQAAANHKQAAIVCPTTILCQQHYANIQARLESLPIKVAMLSRFVDNREQIEIIKKINEGQVDIVVGTHRIFSKDIIFKNLDLLVVDEEQRFGVKQKEHFKKMRSSINILSLSATPIPRTLFMSMSGIRDISQILSPPRGRKSIETTISKYDEEKIVKFIDREIGRGGQVYYLYNRVETIEAVRAKLQKLMPGYKIAVAHGKMNEHNLEEVMVGFAEKKYDVLLCTTIIENGLDLPNVNTLIAENSDKFGLSQLYQIRGRIGRSRRQAFSLLMHNEKNLSTNAFKRLKTLVENTELGSGINVAFSDLEIRGGGNIIGREQHGNLEAVGLTLYSKMLALAVGRLKEGQKASQ